MTLFHIINVLVSENYSDETTDISLIDKMLGSHLSLRISYTVRFFTLAFMNFILY